MSAWYILSTLGFYPVNPANGTFVLGSPQVKKARIHHNNSTDFHIEAKNYNKANIYHESPLLNGEKIKRPHITYSEIMNGGILQFQMKPQ
jgi:putative alpha-1,2-mannosidase